MKKFIYRGLTEEGQEVGGQLLCADKQDAYNQLLDKVKVILELEPKKEILWRFKDWYKRRAFSSATLSLWILQLSELMHSGFSVEASLKVFLEESTLNDEQKEVIAALYEALKAGCSFSVALSQHPKEFPSSLVSVVSSGEQSGKLSDVLSQVAQELEQAEQLKGKLINALSYPFIVSVLSVFMVGFLLAYVVPQITGVLEKNKQQIPLITQVMMFLGMSLKQYGLYFLSFLCGCLLLAKELLKKEEVSLRFSCWILGVPVLGPIIVQYNVFKLSSTLGVMVSSGVSIVNALPNAVASMSNAYLKKKVLLSVIKIQEGASLSQALNGVEHIPSLFISFIKMGERSGNVGKMLQNSAAQIKEGLVRKLQSLVSIAEPLVIVVMGLVVLLIVLSVLLPIIQMNTIAL